MPVLSCTVLNVVNMKTVTQSSRKLQAVSFVHISEAIYYPEQEADEWRREN